MTNRTFPPAHTVLFRGISPVARVALCLALAAAPPACTRQQDRAEGKQETTPTGEASGPASSRHLNYRVQKDPTSLDPHRANDEVSLLYIVNLFDGMVEFAPGSTDIAPALAESWDVSDDGLEYTFHLRQGIQFHNGRPIESSDVVYSLERALSFEEAGPLVGPMLKIRGAREYVEGSAPGISGVASPDPGTVVIRLESSFPPFLGALASQVGSVLPKEVYDQDESVYARQPVGSGPFVFESWETGVGIKIKAFKEHWKGAPGIAGASFRFIPDVNTAFEEFKAGRIDFMNEVPASQRETARTSMTDELKTWARLGFSCVGFNHSKLPFKGNVALRKALNFAVDRKRIAEVLQGGKDIAFSRLIPAGLSGHSPDFGPYHYDPDEARRLLAEAGYPEGKGLPELEMLIWPNDAVTRYSESFQSDLREIGVKVRLSSVDLSAFVEEVGGGASRPPTPDLYALIYYADYPDTDGFLRQLFHSASFGMAGNFGLYSNPDVDKLLDQARTETDPARRHDLYAQAESIALEDAAAIPLYMYGEEALISSELEGFAPSPLGDFAVPLELLHFKS